jgi:hypothetical protein
VKGKTDGQNDMEVFDIGSGPKKVSDPERVVNEKIVILENGQHSHVGDEAHQQKKFPSLSLRPVNQNPREIINEDGENENENVNGNEEHVKHATGNKQVQPSPLMRQKKVEEGDYREEKKKSEAVKNHAYPVGLFLYEAHKAAQI